ncbi:MAG: 50S ribosomal protein L24 [Alphaproteobacteria bacterium]|nr:50S ribosomal protein L24 [Alphaproteobacteria bacterium]
MKNRFKIKLHIKKGDKVVVIAGASKDRTKVRTVTEVFPSESKVLIEGVNIKVKHLKPTAQSTKGGISKIEAPIHISNVQLWDSKTSSPTRIIRKKEDGKSYRISKKSGEELK